MKKAATCSIVVLALFFSAVSAQGQWREFTSLSEKVRATDGVITQLHLDWSGPTRNVRARSAGDLVLAAGDTLVASISANGFLLIEERRLNQYRKIEVRADSNGVLEKQHWVQNEPAPFTAEAQQWFGRLLLELVRETGINSKRRTERLFASGGEAGVLAEIDAIFRERSKRFYYERLLEQSYLSDQTLLAIARRVREGFSADANLRIVIAAMMARHKLDSKTLGEALLAIREINDERTRANLLLDIADLLPDEPELRQIYDRIAGNIASPTERARALSASK